MAAEREPIERKDRRVQRFLILLWFASLLAMATFDVAFAQSPDTMPDALWSATLYLGPSTTKFVSQIVLDHDFAPSGATAGLTLDRRLFYLGWDFSLGAEAQLTQGVSGRTDTTISLGLGLEFSGFPWTRRLPTTLSVYTGPSVSFNPPKIGGQTGNEHYFGGKTLLNYVGIELAVAIPDTSHWDGVIRIFHRSGAFGLYSIDADEGTTIGLGVRRRF